MSDNRLGAHASRVLNRVVAYSSTRDACAPRFAGHFLKDWKRDEDARAASHCRWLVACPTFAIRFA